MLSETLDDTRKALAKAGAGGRPPEQQRNVKIRCS